MPNDRLTCGELLELVTDHLEGALTPPQRLRFERHLVTCYDCVIHLEQLRETIRLTGRLAERGIDPAARDRLLGAFRGWQRSVPREPDRV